jgi:hypothetical protein
MARSIIGAVVTVAGCAGLAYFLRYNTISNYIFLVNRRKEKMRKLLDIISEKGIRKFVSFNGQMNFDAFDAVSTEAKIVRQLCYSDNFVVNYKAYWSTLKSQLKQDDKYIIVATVQNEPKVVERSAEMLSFGVKAKYGIDAFCVAQDADQFIVFFSGSPKKSLFEGPALARKYD